MVAVVDAVVVYVAVYLVEHMDTNGLYLGLLGYSKRAVAVFSALISVQRAVLSLLSSFYDFCLFDFFFDFSPFYVVMGNLIDSSFHC